MVCHEPNQLFCLTAALLGVNAWQDGFNRLQGCTTRLSPYVHCRCVMAVQSSLEMVEAYNGPVLYCLQDFRDELTDDKCKAEVHKLTERASQDIRFTQHLAELCFKDREKYCAGVQPVRAAMPIHHPCWKA